MANNNWDIILVATLLSCSALAISNAHIVGVLSAIRHGLHHGGGGGDGGGTVFNVVDFGAKPQKHDNSQPFIKAWNAACNFNGKARMYVPPGVFMVGEVLFVGPCKNPNPMVQIVGTLKAVPDLSLYADQGWINFESVNGLIVTGGGVVDGNGQSFWKYNDCDNNPNCVHLPAAMHFDSINDARIKAINFINSMGFHLHIGSSSDFRVMNIRITSPKDSPNTDGIHISKSQMVRVSRSIIQTGDDCISIGQGATNVTVNKVTCGPGHGISIGSLGKLQNEEDVKGLIVKNCSLIGTTNGVRIKTYAASDASLASGMLFQDIVMDNVQNPIVIDQHYKSSSKNEPSMVKISDVIYENIRGTTTTPNAIALMCSSKVPCQNVRFTNINLKIINGKSPLISVCDHAQVLTSGIQIPPLCTHLPNKLNH